MIFVNTPFMQRLQNEEVGNLVEIISLEGKGFREFWTLTNQEVFATLSGELIEYKPFPGRASGSIQSATDLTVATMEFVMASSGANSLSRLVDAYQLDAGVITVDRIFADTPDMGRMPVYRGRIGDVARNRQVVRAQARNVWDSRGTQYPLYTYEDGCVWRFGSAGCGFDTTSVTIAINGFSVNSSDRVNLYSSRVGSETDDFWTFGRVTWTAGVNSGQQRAVRQHTGPLLSLSHALPFTPVSGDLFSIYPGCRKRRVSDCTSKYDNAENYLGFWTTPIPEEFGVGE